MTHLRKGDLVTIVGYDYREDSKAVPVPLLKIVRVYPILTVKGKDTGQIGCQLLNVLTKLPMSLPEKDLILVSKKSIIMKQLKQ